MKRSTCINTFLFVFLLIAGIQAGKTQTGDDQALQVARGLVTLFNQGDFNGAYALFNEEMRKAATVSQIEGVWKSIIQSKGAYEGETGHAVANVKEFKSVVLTTKFKNDSQNIIITVTDKGQIAGLFLRPVEPPKTDLAANEQEISFKSGEDSFFGTLLIPENAKGKVPAALLISGSGPTDRDGNNSLLSGKIDSHKNFARILANAGVASLRYDKYGTGKTGLGSYANKLSSITFDTYVDLALAAYQYLGSRPEIDPTRLAILGHSEGAFIALVAADRMKAATPPNALLLAAPLAKPYLVTLREQIAGQYATAVRAGIYTQQQADDGMAELDRIIAQVIKDGTVPEKMAPQFTPLFLPQNLRFLQNASRYDPQTIAASLPESINLIMICGQKDQQIPCDDVKLLVDGLKQAGNRKVAFVELPNVNHVFKEVEGTPNPTTDYTDPSKRFSREAERILAEFAQKGLFH